MNWKAVSCPGRPPANLPSPSPSAASSLPMALRASADRPSGSAGVARDCRVQGCAAQNRDDGQMRSPDCFPVALRASAKRLSWSTDVAQDCTGTVMLEGRVVEAADRPSESADAPMRVSEAALRTCRPTAGPGASACAFRASLLADVRSGQRWCTSQRCGRHLADAAQLG